jgi:hypothetical protein
MDERVNSLSAQEGIEITTEKIVIGKEIIAITFAGNLRRLKIEMAIVEERNWALWAPQNSARAYPRGTTPYLGWAL